jgi:prepilin-type N-terminal cleavage/methylation domain-containing protein
MFKTQKRNPLISSPLIRGRSGGGLSSNFLPLAKGEVRRGSYKKAFTLLEIMAVVVIIGVLASLAGASVLGARSRAVDAQRLNDIKQMQYYLDAFAQYNGEYPQDQEFIPGGSLVSRNGQVVYLTAIPHNPVPRTGCPDSDYLYHQTGDGHGYILTYCLSNKVGDLTAGPCVALPGIVCVQNTACSCADAAKPCCGYCDPTATCLHTP